MIFNASNLERKLFNQEIKNLNYLIRSKILTNMSLSKINLEGKLSKFTNVIKGYQFRHFVIDPYTATLNYYIVSIL